MSKKRIIIFYIVYFLFAISTNIVHPITVHYVNSLSLPDAYFGFLFSLMSLGQVVGALFFGFLSDKIGRKWLIFIGIIGYCLSQFGFGFINNYPFLVLMFRFFAGICVSAPNTLFISMCLDVSSKEKKVKMLSIFSSCYILGAALGYEIGGSLLDYLHFSISQIFIFQIVFALTNATIFAIFVKDSFIKNKATTNQEKHKIHPLVYFLLFNLAILTISQIIINKYFETYIIHIGYESSDLGHFSFISGIISAISNISIIPVFKTIKNKKVGYFLLLFIALSSTLTFITFLSKGDFMYFVYSSFLLYIVIKGLITPLEQNELSQHSNINNNGKLTGFRQTTISIGNVIGPLIGSAIYVKGSNTIFIVAGFICIFALLLYIIYFVIKNRCIK